MLPWLALGTLFSTTLAAPASTGASVPYKPYTLPRLVTYLQSANAEDGTPVSTLPLVTEPGVALTHLVVSSLHIAPGRSIALNDWPPDDARYDALWAQAAVLQQAGVRVLGMLGGAAAGSYANTTLDSSDTATFELYYQQLHDTIRAHGLQGIDLDVEQSMSQAGITRLVKRLCADFVEPSGRQFEITLAPVAAGLLPPPETASLSGFSYQALEHDAGDCIAFYNAQLYNGWGGLDTPAFAAAMLGDGTGRGPDTPWPAAKVVLGALTAPANGDGFVNASVLNATVASLAASYDPLGGLMGWEYVNSEPGGTVAPWTWAQNMTAILRPGQTVAARMSHAHAHALAVQYAQARNLTNQKNQTMNQRSQRNQRNHTLNDTTTVPGRHLALTGSDLD